MFVQQMLGWVLNLKGFRPRHKKLHFGTSDGAAQTTRSAPYFGWYRAAWVSFTALEREQSAPKMARPNHSPTLKLAEASFGLLGRPLAALKSDDVDNVSLAPACL
jgi:hypothetical protein